jgi:hypothetical protein
LSQQTNDVLGCGILDAAGDSVVNDDINCALGYSPKKTIWQVVLYVSIALWPLTLAILVVVTTKNTSLSSAVARRMKRAAGQPGGSHL